MPFKDYLDALRTTVREPLLVSLVSLVIGGILSWWLYVPVHELLHAAGCLVAGGTVSRLEIDAMYGALFLQHWFPFVAVGSEYAGQLTGFDTHGSDFVFLVTDFLPFTMTIFIAIPLLRWLGRTSLPAPGGAFLLGASLPIAFAPAISLTGDYYEMGSILTTRIVRWVVQDFDVTRWRSDDVFKLLGELMTDAGSRLPDLAGVCTAALLGVVLAYATYGAGVLVDGLYRRISSIPPTTVRES